jgi:hypothetical protein
LEGRSDKKFCDPYCKSAYQYQKTKEDTISRYQIVQNQLRLNRRILKFYNKAGKSVIRKEELIKEGFNPRFFTNYWKNRKGDIYWFIYEFGFLSKKENNKEKYVLVMWQDYMEY